MRWGSLLVRALERGSCSLKRPGRRAALFAEQVFAIVAVRQKRAHVVGPDVLFELGIRAAAGDDAVVSEIPASVGLDGFDLDRVVRPPGAMPESPKFPAVGQVVGDFDIDQLGPLPMVAPPIGAVQAP